MTEITDLNPTDALNTSIGAESLQGNVANMGRMDNTLQAFTGLLARSIRSNILRFLDGTDATKKLALDLSGITTATTRTLTVPNKSGTLAMTSDLSSYAGKLDTRRNRIVNHDMRASFEANGASGTANGFYPVEQWAQYRVTSAGVLTVQQVASVTPAGSPNRIRATVTTADTSLAAGEYWTISQNLEGSNVADFQYGGANAKQSVLRFGFKGPAGTYAAALHNSGTTRSYVALFTISAGQANTDTVQTIVIPGDTAGTWLTADGVIGITLDIVLAAGSTFQGSAGWQNGNILATSAVTNGMGTGASVFELFDVGLRLDPDATGVYGQYEVAEVDAVYRSERYAYFRGTGTTVGSPIVTGQIPISTSFQGVWELPSPMPATITLSTSAAATFGIYQQGGVATATGVPTVGQVSTDRRAILINVASGGMTVGSAATLINTAGNVARIGVLARLS